MSGSVGDNPYRASGVIAAAAAGGGISWQSVETGATFTAVAGNGYPVNTTAQACTVTLPAGSVGDTIELVDYAGTWDTNNVTLTTTEKIKGSDLDHVLIIERQGIKIVYVDATQGWEAITGVNETAPAMAPLSYDIDFLVVGGGGSGASNSNSGGGGAGGYRTATGISVNEGTVITITVGDGGAGNISTETGVTGDASSFSGSGLTTISSAGGGGGASNNTTGLSGGSGGGGGYDSTSSGGSGNTPSTDPRQGYDGGDGAGYVAPAYGAGGGGGASEDGDNGTSSKGGDGGDGVASSISGSSVTRGGGGGGGTNTTVGSGGAGGGGAAGPHPSGNGTAGGVNTGGGGGGCEGGSTSGSGGKGVVVLSMLDAKYSSTTTGSPTVDTDAGGTGKTTLVYTGSGTYTA